MYIIMQSQPNIDQRIASVKHMVVVKKKNKGRKKIKINCKRQANSFEINCNNMTWQVGPNRQIKCNGSTNSKLNPTIGMNKTSKLTKPQASNTKKNYTQKWKKGENKAQQNRSNTTGSRVNECVKMLQYRHTRKKAKLCFQGEVVKQQCSQDVYKFSHLAVAT